MRLDLVLKESRLIKRRTVAKELCLSGRILVNDKEAKPSFEVKENNDDKKPTNADQQYGE